MLIFQGCIYTWNSPSFGWLVVSTSCVASLLTPFVGFKSWPSWCFMAGRNYILCFSECRSSTFEKLEFGNTQDQGNPKPSFLGVMKLWPIYWGPFQPSLFMALGSKGRCFSEAFFWGKTYCEWNISSSHGLEEIKVIIRIKIQWHVELFLFSCSSKFGFPTKNLSFQNIVRFQNFLLVCLGVFSYQISSTPMCGTLKLSQRASVKLASGWFRFFSAWNRHPWLWKLVSWIGNYFVAEVFLEDHYPCHPCSCF